MFSVFQLFEKSCGRVISVDFFTTFVNDGRTCENVTAKSPKMVDDFHLNHLIRSGALDLVETILTRIYLQKSASIQPRTSFSKFAKS